MLILNTLNIIGFVILVAHVNCKAVDNSLLDDDDGDDHNKFTREWAVKIGDPVEADLIAIETKSINMGLIKPFKDVYLFVNPNVPQRHKRAAHEHHERLVNHEKVAYSTIFVYFCFTIISGICRYISNFSNV
jgi:hypothetical protein